MQDNEVVTTTKSEIKEFVTELKTSIVEETKAATIEALKVEQAKNALPPAMNNDRSIQMKSVVEKNALGIAVAAIGAAGKYNTPIETAYKSMGVEPSMFLTEEMRSKIDNEKTLSLKYDTKTMNTSTGADGGFLIREIYYPQILPMLEEKAVFMDAKPNTVPMDGGNISMTKAISGTTAYWQGENDNKTASAKTWGQINMSSKILTAMVPVSNRLLKRADLLNVGQDIVQDITKHMALKQDQTFLMTGTGTNYTPKSLYSCVLTGSSYTNAMTGSPSAANIAADLQKAKLNLIKNTTNNLIRPVWFMTEEAKFIIECQVNPTSGQPTLYAQELMTKGTLYGFDVKTTSYMRDTNGTTSTIILADMGYVYVGKVQDIEIKFTPDGTYYDGSVAVSGLSKDESVYTAMYETDLDVVEPKGLSRITGVTWGIAYTS